MPRSTSTSPLTAVAHIHRAQGCVLDQNDGERAAVGSANEAHLGLQLLRNALNGQTSTMTTPAALACASNCGYKLHDLSHDVVAVIPSAYSVTAYDSCDDVSSMPEMMAFAPGADGTGGAVYRKTMDYQHRGDELRTARYMLGAADDGPDEAFDPRVEFSPYVLAMWYRRETVKTGHSGIRFRPAHPDASTHHLVRRRFKAVPYFTDRVPARPADDADDAARAAYASFALGNFRDDDLLRAVADAADGEPDWWAELLRWEATADPTGTPPQRYAADCKRVLANIDTRVKAASQPSQTFRMRRLEQRAAEGREPAQVTACVDRSIARAGLRG